MESPQWLKHDVTTYDQITGLTRCTKPQIEYDQLFGDGEKMRVVIQGVNTQESAEPRIRRLPLLEIEYK